MEIRKANEAVGRGTEGFAVTALIMIFELIHPRSVSLREVLLPYNLPADH